MLSDVCSSYCSYSKNWCKTQTQFHEVEFDWVIDNFDFHETKGTELKSSKFSTTTNNKFKWYLYCEPNGKTEQKDTISISLYCDRDLNESVFGKYTISLLDYQRNVIMIRSSKVREFESTKTNWGWRDYIKKDVGFQNRIEKNSTLTIHCSVKFSEMNDVNVSFHQCKSKISSCSLSEDLALLLDHQEVSDVILSVNGKEYKAHKNILSARSPVFAAMFRHNTTETEQNRVVIEGVDENVMSEMLRYIYTGRCQNLHEFADGLLAAADKYALDQLKIMCMEELSKTLSAENASNILILADFHGVKELKIEVIKFIVANFAEVSKTTGWGIIVSKSVLVDEVCHALACQLVPT